MHDSAMISARRSLRYILEYYRSRPDLVVSLLERIGAGGVHMVGGEIRCACPIHHGRNTNNFVVWVDGHVPIWKCFSGCSAQGDLAKLLQVKYSCKFLEAISWLFYNAGLHFDGNTIEVGIEAYQEETLSQWKRRAGVRDETAEVHAYPEWMVNSSTQMECSYFRDRGFSKKLLDAFEVGFVPAGTWTWLDSNKCDEQGRPVRVGWMEDRVSIPIRQNDGLLIGFSGRRLDGVKFKKYKILPGTMKSKALYGMHQALTQRMITRSRQVNLVEGFVDTWQAWRHDCFNTVGVMGTSISSHQIKLISDCAVERITTFFDGDLPGQTAAKNLGEQLKGIASVHNAVPPVGVDPGDIRDREFFCRLIHDAPRVH